MGRFRSGYGEDGSSQHNSYNIGQKLLEVPGLDEDTSRQHLPNADSNSELQSIANICNKEKMK
jgi:hypothetical protein